MSNDKRDGFDNLQEQLKSAYRHCNQMSYKTRAAYYNHTGQFLKFYYEKFHGQKFVNVKGKHIRTYVEFMQEKGLAATTVMARLSGIRFSYDIAKGKHRLHDNSELGLKKREIGKENRAWLSQEIAGALELKPDGRIEDFVVVASAYPKNAVQNLINTSDILYVDENKKRTDSWLKARGLQLPEGVTNYGSIGIVTYTDKNVKGQITFDTDKPTKTAMQTALEKAGYANYDMQNSENDTVIVRQTGKNRYYTHRILMPNGTEFVFNDTKKKQSLHPLICLPFRTAREQPSALPLMALYTQIVKMSRGILILTKECLSMKRLKTPLIILWKPVLTVFRGTRQRKS